jgi:hypothetical protein
VHHTFTKENVGECSVDEMNAPCIHFLSYAFQKEEEKKTAMKKRKRDGTLPLCFQLQLGVKARHFIVSSAQNILLRYESLLGRKL